MFANILLKLLIFAPCVKLCAAQCSVHGDISATYPGYLLSCVKYKVLMYDRCECVWKYTTNNAPAFVIIAKYVEIYIRYLLITYKIYTLIRSCKATKK